MQMADGLAQILGQGRSGKSVRNELPAASQGLGSWVVGALQGRVRIKWKSTPSANPARAHQKMELVETLSLGGKRQVMLIECQGERYLVGCGTDSVATIEKLSPETRPAAIKAVAQTWS